MARHIAPKPPTTQAAVEPAVVDTAVSAKDKVDIVIMIEGKEATEYPAEPELDVKAGREVLTRYVEVTSGAQFSFRIKVSPRYCFGREDVLTPRIRIDGQWAGGNLLYKAQHSVIIGSQLDVDCMWEGNGPSARKISYHFADLETRDTANVEELKNMKEKYAALGTLEVTLSREIYQGNKQGILSKINNIGAVPEKALKGRSLDVAAQLKSTGIGLAPPVARTTTIDSQPFFKKKFLYRTKKALQSEMIIPRSPSPQPLEERAEEDLTPEELRELVRKQKAQLAIKQEEKTKIKRERSKSPPRSTRAFKSSRNHDGKKIYHLESDDEEEDAVTSSPDKPVEPIEVIEL